MGQQAINTAAKSAPSAKAAGKGKPRHRILKWRGVLSEQPLHSRLIAFAFVILCAAGLTVTQLGFLGVGLPGEYIGYCVLLLAPVAAAGLMFGIPLGTLAGLLTGLILFLHARFMPLDYYEVHYVTIISSIILFTIVGFGLSLSFAIALRKDPPSWRKIIYILLVCGLWSSIFSLFFLINAIFQLVFHYAQIAVHTGADLDSKEIINRAFSAISQLGDITMQRWVDALVMALVCIAIVFVYNHARAGRDNRSLRTIFRAWLFVVVGAAFVIVSAISFVIITEQCKADTKEDMDSELGYLQEQIVAYGDRLDSLATIVEPLSSERENDEEFKADVKQVSTYDYLLRGYSKNEDGTIVVTYEDVVLITDDDDFHEGSTIKQVFSQVTDEQMNRMLNDGEMLQVVDDRALLEYNQSQHEGDSSDEAAELLNQPISTQMSYLRASKVNDFTLFMMLPAPKVFRDRTGVMIWTTLTVLILLIVVYLLASWLLSHVVVNNINKTNDVLAQITDGNLDARVNLHDSREFSSLSTGVNTTVGALKGWIAEAEQRMDQELETAKAIQESALPRIFPPFPDIRRFDIYASMNPARQVGGDFYDFFLIGDGCGSYEGKLGFVIADVSGKGVPAALFMMAAKTHIRNYMLSGMSPGEAVENANCQLCDGNDAGMFVTVFAGVLDYGTGHMEYVNAGHNPPVLWRAGAWEWLKDISGMPLGLFDSFPYDTFTADLQVGDQLMMYTDGVTEAMNVEGELFGEERLLQLLNDHFTLHPRALVNGIRHSLSLFTKNAEQSDDITMLCLEHGVPPELTATLTVPADDHLLPVVNEFIHSELDRRLCPLKAQKQLDIALEELFVNQCHYAYPQATPEKPGIVRIAYTYCADPPSIVVELADKGMPYNPLEKPDAVTPDNIEDVPIGGLGILMAKKCVDDMQYEYEDNWNRVTITKTW